VVKIYSLIEMQIFFRERKLMTRGRMSTAAWLYLILIIGAVLLLAIGVPIALRQIRLDATAEQARVNEACEQAVEKAFLDKWKNMPSGDWFFRVYNETMVGGKERSDAIVSLYTDGAYAPTDCVMLPNEKDKQFTISVQGKEGQIVQIWTFLMEGGHHIQPDGMAAEAGYEFALGEKGISYLQFRVDTRGREVLLGGQVVKEYRIELLSPPKGMKRLEF